MYSADKIVFTSSDNVCSYLFKLQEIAKVIDTHSDIPEGLKREASAEVVKARDLAAKGADRDTISSTLEKASSLLSNVISAGKVVEKLKDAGMMISRLF